MKKQLLYLVFLLFSTYPSNAAPEAISMVSYEQSWLDNKGTLALKNNTTEEIHNITFIIEYLDMTDTPMDYEEYFRQVNIAPGMTRKVNIPAYEHDRNYHYYKTKDNFGHPAFKITYKLKTYNTSTISKTDVPSLNRNTDANEALSIIIAIIVCLMFLAAYIGFYVLVCIMAKHRNRNPAIWLLLSFVTTPFLIAIILLAIGSAPTKEY